jgi:hypothetical protein
LQNLLNDDEIDDFGEIDEDLVGDSEHSDNEQAHPFESPRAMLKSMREEAHKKISIEIEQQKLRQKKKQ